MEITPDLIIGSIGATLILVPFLMNQIGKWNSETFSYDFSNMVGSGLLLWSALITGSIPFIVINLVWGLFSAKDVVLYLTRPKVKQAA